MRREYLGMVVPISAGISSPCQPAALRRRGSYGSWMGVKCGSSSSTFSEPRSLGLGRIPRNLSHGVWHLHPHPPTPPPSVLHNWGGCHGSGQALSHFTDKEAEAQKLKWTTTFTAVSPLIRPLCHLGRSGWSEPQQPGQRSVGNSASSLNDVINWHTKKEVVEGEKTAFLHSEFPPHYF